MIAVVAFDESGNTGQDLLNPAQPIFVVASISIADEDAQSLIAPLSAGHAEEAKFQHLKGSAAGQRALLSCLRSPLITPQSAKLFVVHKGYMVTTKMVDLLVEPLAHADGVDLYQQGANIALANMHHMGLPAFCGPATALELQQAFVEMIRRKDPASITRFYACANRVYQACSNAKYKTLLAPIIASHARVGDLLEDVDRTEIDPALPVFIRLCDTWGRQLGGEFDAVHDQSKPLEQQQQLIAFVSARDEREIEVGYDRRKISLPLKMRSVAFVDSRTVPQVQLADILAGTCAYWIGRMVGVSVDPSFWARLNGAGIENLVIDAIWPSSAVSPGDLGTQKMGGINSVDYLAELIGRQRQKMEQE